MAMRAALAAHDEALGAAVEAHGGFLFKHTGDGVCAAFASPRSAVDAAVAAQRALELPVRMGLATGEAELRGADYFGAVLNRAARVMAAGHGGQVLLDGTTAGLCSSIDLIALGPRRLRDIAKPVEMFQVLAARPAQRVSAPCDARRDAGEPAPSNDELHRTRSRTGRGARGAEGSSVGDVDRGGRGRQDPAGDRSCGAPGRRVPGRRLVVRAGRGRRSGGGARRGGRGAGHHPTTGQEPGRQRGRRAGGPGPAVGVRQLRALRDAAADLVEAILAHSATVRILATSREGLGVADEQLWLVPSLEVGAGIDSAAVSLFVERARSVASRFSVATADEAAAVVEICRRLDGIPLAIELAASRMASMTAGEVRDRLDQRFRLLVGSRRGLERHHTLRHAVAWSYDLLDDGEKSLLERCSVFAGGFDLQSACAVGGFDGSDDYAVLDLLDALVRKSLLVADRSSGRTRFSMLETIRQFAEEQLVAGGEATEVRTAHARYFAGRETDILALWDSPGQREAYTWFTAELANLRTAFRWAADNGVLDVAAAIASYAALLGVVVDNYEPITWAEELIEPARAVNHPRLATLYMLASQCYWTGRIEEAVGYADAGQTVIGSGGEVAFGAEGTLSAVYPVIGQPERNVEWCRAQLARGRDTHTITRTMLVAALAVAGAGEEARAAANGLIEAAEATHNPQALANALYGYGYAFGDADPVRALEALRRGLVIAQDSGNRLIESLLATALSRLEAEHGDPLAALDHITLAIRNFYDSGNVAYIRFSLATLAVLLDRLGRLEPAATIAGFAFSPLAAASVPQLTTAIAHLRDALGDQTYESLARKGETMTTSEVATYAYDQIDQARTELEHPS